MKGRGGDFSSTGYGDRDFSPTRGGAPPGTGIPRPTAIPSSNVAHHIFLGNDKYKKRFSESTFFSNCVSVLTSKQS